MSVDRRPADRFSSNREQALRTSLHLANFIKDNLKHLRKVDKAGKMEAAAKEFREKLLAGESLTPPQLSYLEGIYEKCMEGAGYEAAPVHVDRKRRSLKYG